ncbi:Protein SHQ1-like protein [Aphelenchoides fujianensis]|nr:Protein SHQ1-like protein [Aphelenchoides fujianensis]
MITPFFKLRQDEDAVTVEIRAPNANIRDTEIEFFERTFCFSAAPYFLRLYLPGEMLSELIKPQRPSAAKLVEEVDVGEVERELDESEAIDVDAFSSEHYLADLFDPTPELTAALELEIPPTEFELNDEDRLQLKDLRVVRLPELSEQEREQAAFSMVDVLFSFLFDLRITDLEHNACSDGMIGKLSPSLSGLVRFASVRDALRAAVRRSLCFSLFRHFDLAVRAARDVLTVMQKGRSAILHCFLRLRSRFNNSGQDFTYLYNQLFIDDYALFVQSMDEGLLQRVTADLKTALEELKRADIPGLDLEYVETEAKMIRLAVEAGEYDSDDE